MSCVWASGNIDPADKYAWSENVGWVNFAPSNGGVTVVYNGANGYLSGYAWGENIGWIKLGDDSAGPYNNNSSTDWGVNLDAGGNLSGFAWGENVGWIKFDSAYNQATIDLVTGRFDGYAWGENIGWLRLKGTAPDFNVRAKVFDNLLPEGMVVIPAGTNSGTDPDFGAYSLTNTVPLYMDKYEVTKAQWDAVYTWATNNHGYYFDNAGSGKDTNHPVQTVSWYDVVKWCNARSQRDGFMPCYTNANGTIYTNGAFSGGCNWSAVGYRLPTEAEWEYAARGGASGRRFSWSDSDTIQHARANYVSSSTCDYDTSPTRGYHPTYTNGVAPYTSPAGSFAPNGYGLYDMAGNVWEWCWDWYPGSEGAIRLIHSGCWEGVAQDCRIARRGGASPEATYDGLGFRAILVETEPLQIISFPNPGPQITTNTLSLSANASSGLLVSFTNLPGSPIQWVNPTQIIFTGTGTVSIVASQAGDINWNPAPSITNTFIVTKAVAQVILSNLFQTYNGSNRVVTASTIPTGLAVDIIYDGGVTAPVTEVWLSTRFFT